MVQTLWQEFLTIVREQVGSRVVETWFKAVRCIRWDSQHKCMYLEAPNHFVKEWLSTHYKELFVTHLSRLLNESKISIEFIDAHNGANAHHAMIKPAVVATAAPEQFKAAVPLTKMSRIEAPRGRVGLNATYVFDSFVVGPSNQLAFAAALAVTEKPGKLYNPLFIYGPSGLGKTHLLHAIGNKINESNKKSRILYQTADRFVNEFISAIRFDKMYQFEAKYKDIDVLLVDDIQFISNKEQTQEAFFHIFNMLHQTHKQIVFTSDSMPCDIAGLAERMRSRLEGGLIADIKFPTLETKIAILQKKAQFNNIELPSDVAYFIASHHYNNIRELEGTLVRLIAYMALAQEMLTLELAQRVLQKNKMTDAAVPSLMSIAQKVMLHCEVTLTELRSSKRNKELAQARHIAMYLMKKHTTSSLKEIGIFFSRTDHTTVLHAYEKIEQLLITHQETQHLIKKIEQALT